MKSHRAGGKGGPASQKGGSVLAPGFLSTSRQAGAEGGYRFADPRSSSQPRRATRAVLRVHGGGPCCPVSSPRLRGQGVVGRTSMQTGLHQPGLHAQGSSRCGQACPPSTVGALSGTPAIPGQWLHTNPLAHSPTRLRRVLEMLLTISCPHLCLFLSP